MIQPAMGARRRFWTTHQHFPPASQAHATTGGAADAKSVAETVLEVAACVLARALANFFKKTGDLVELVNDKDDLVLQFDGTDASKRFLEARKRARIIVDKGGGDTPAAPPEPAPPPA